MDSAAQRLKNLRLEKGLSLEDIQKKTRIQANILRALEGDSVTTLNPVYLQGFLKIYCKFLGADPNDFIQEKKETKHKAAPEPQVVQTKPQETKGFPGESKSKATFKTVPEKIETLTPPKNLKKIIIIALVVLVFSFGLFKLGKAISSRKNSEVLQQKVKTPPKVVAKSPAITVPAKVTTLKTASVPAKKETSSEIRMVIRAREKCWISLKADGKTVFHGMLEKGRSESWKAKDRLDLFLGNAGVVELEVDGQLFSNLGRKGQTLKNVVITKKGLEVK